MAASAHQIRPSAAGSDEGGFGLASSDARREKSQAGHAREIGGSVWAINSELGRACASYPHAGVHPSPGTGQESPGTHSADHRP